MVRDGVISDELWAVLEPLLPPRVGRPGRPWNDHRLTLEGIAWRFRVGAPWRDVPVEFGKHQSVWQRHRLWSTDGTYQRMLEAVQAGSGGPAPELVNVLSVDSTVVRAHQHAAGARFRDQGGDQVGAEPGGAAAARDTGGLVESQEMAR
jgi:transposase